MLDSTAPVMTRHTISIFHVNCILEGARRQGVDTGALLKRSGIPPLLLQSSRSRVAQDQYARLLSLLSRTMRDEFFGLCSHPVRPGTFAHLCRELILCETLGQALRKGFAFYHLILRDFTARLSVNGNLATVSVSDGAEGECHSYARRIFTFFSWGLASWLVARRVPLLRVNYQEAERQSVNSNLIFQAPIHYNQPNFGFSFEARWLDLPVVQNPLSIREFFRQAPANLLVKYRDETSCSERIRRLLRRHLSDGLPTLDEVGEVLGMTPQTLRRRLRDEGQCYQGLKDSLRCDAAIEYLARADLSLQDVAIRVGFSELSTFHRAFKKWTGLPPGEYRYTRLRRALARPRTGQN
ncbi:AraC family transcriptional regulator [Alcanivorax sp. N3-2A]|nr:AraC family transcriptional regulator [Alcanivorax sp. N3-2A]|tara:strand:- start:41229 stop:42287 length:1059 start_codon:yes stop_codon:yes gene_type:complete